ncbi:hypothetical protein [Kordia zhangzhouensis]|uniref:hypothetical protein n=1 Tax=Kordia zhangzhouensis TaxID=1620405 RepID=UPI0006295FAC|nr:hypothetical protein [Kordia zhangzhouensis]
MKKNELHTNQTGFKTPKEYFENFEDRFFERLTTESTIPETSGFKAPEMYFNRLEDTLSEKLFSNESETKVISLQFKKNYQKYIRYAVAACLVLVSSVAIYQNTKEIISIETVENSEINTFIENDLIALNNYELVNVYEEENVDITAVFEVELDESETLDYLEKTTDPYELLIE